MIHLNNQQNTCLPNTSTAFKEPIHRTNNFLQTKIILIEILNKEHQPAPPKRCQYDPKGWLMGTPYHSFSTP